MNLAGLNYVKLLLEAFELCFIPGGFRIFAAKRTRGRKMREDFLLLYMHPSMTHTAGSASFHNSCKSQGSVMTFILSNRAPNTLLQEEPHPFPLS